MRLKPSLIFALLLLSPGAAIAKPTSNTPTPLPENRDPYALFTEDATYISQTLIMQLEHRRVDLQVPVEFFEDPWDRKNGFADTAQLFRVEIGSFIPVSRPETGRRNKLNVWNWMDFLIGDKIPLEQLAEFNVERWINGFDPDQDFSTYARSVGPFGLATILTVGKLPTKQFQTDTYLSESPETGLTAVLRCGVPGGPPYPICQHWFRAAGMDIELSYRRTELPNWQALQDDVTKFLTCATTSKT